MSRHREKKPAWIVRLAHRLGWYPGKVMSEVLEWVEVLAVAGVLAVLVMTFVTVRMHVPTESMIPVIEPRDSFFVDRITYQFREPVPGDIVVFWHTDAVLIQSVDERLADFGLSEGDQVTYLNGIFPSGASRPIGNIRTHRIRVETIFGGLPCRRSVTPRVSPSRAPVARPHHGAFIFAAFPKQMTNARGRGMRTLGID